MSDIMKIIDSFKGRCACGMCHDTAVRDVRIGSGLVNSVGDILRDNGFPKRLLLVADKNTLKAAEGIEKSLRGFEVEYKIYSSLRVAEIRHVCELERLIENREIAVLSVGTGSVNDPCRLAAARQNKPLCIFATAPSMDGFASYSSPLVDNGFKASYPAKSPEIIIGDTAILAGAPAYLKSAGFGDMIAKYVGLIDWQVSSLLTDELYCPRVAALTRSAVDMLMENADKVTVNDEETAGKIFEALLTTGIAMSFMKNSRPASGSEHIIAHLIECLQLKDGITPNYHGEDVGVCTLEMLKFYNELAARTEIEAQPDNPCWDKIYSVYGDMAQEVKRLNTPNPADKIEPQLLERKWRKICAAVKAVPSYNEARAAMQKAGCKITVQDIGKSRELFETCVEYSPYMRNRITLLRIKNMIK